MSELGKTEAAQDKQTTVEDGTVFKGTLQSTCRVVVRGVVEGELDAPVVEVAASGAVTGTVKAKTLHSSGGLAGRVDVDELVLSGSVRDETIIRAKSLDVKLQSDRTIEVKFGECVLEVGEDPALELPEASSVGASAGEAASSPSASASSSSSGSGSSSGSKKSEGKNGRKEPAPSADASKANADASAKGEPASASS